MQNVDLGGQRSYAATFTALVGAAALTDLVTITGAQGRIVKVSRITITGIATAAAVADVAIIRRTTANTAGTSTAVVPTERGALRRDGTGTIQADAAYSTVLQYTVNPTLGTANPPTGGTIFAQKMAIGTAAGTVADPLQIDFNSLGMEQPTLIGNQDVLAINLAGGTFAGNAYTGTIEFTEQSQ
jgi:hypothetical protein